MTPSFLSNSRRVPLALAGTALALIVAVVVLTRARAEGFPTPGGTVPSTLSLSLSEPSPFRRIGRSNRFIAVVRARVTATDVPVKLSVGDGEVSAGRRLGHMASQHSVLPDPLWAAAVDHRYRSLDSIVPAPLRHWEEPAAGEVVRVRLQQTAPNARALRNHRKLVLITLTAGGP